MSDIFLEKLTDCFLAEIVTIHANGTLTVKPVPNRGSRFPNLSNVQVLGDVSECEVGTKDRVFFENNQWWFKCNCPPNWIWKEEYNDCVPCCLAGLRVEREGLGFCIACDVFVSDGQDTSPCTQGVGGAIYATPIVDGEWSWNSEQTTKIDFDPLNENAYYFTFESPGLYRVKIEIWDYCNRLTEEFSICNCPSAWPNCHPDRNRCENRDGCPINYQLSGNPRLCRDQFGCLEGYLWDGTCRQCRDAIRQCLEGYNWNGTQCVDKDGCPEHLVLLGSTCVSRCAPQGIWAWDKCNQRCVDPCGCPEGQVCNATNNGCVDFCPPHQIWSGQERRCVNRCDLEGRGERWNMDITPHGCTSVCNDPNPQPHMRWDREEQKCVERCNLARDGVMWAEYGQRCVGVCPQGRVWDAAEFARTGIPSDPLAAIPACKCPAGMIESPAVVGDWNFPYGRCHNNPCPAGTIRHSDGFTCVSLCANHLNTVWQSETFSFLRDDQKNLPVTGGFCVCNNWQQIWDTDSNRCVNRCPGGQRWNSTDDTCACIDSQIWDAAQQRCVNRCPHNQIWDTVTRICVCPTGATMNAQGVCVTPPGPVIPPGPATPQCGQKGSQREMAVLLSPPNGRCITPQNSTCMQNHGHVWDEGTGRCHVGCDLELAIANAPYEIYVVAYYDATIRNNKHICGRAEFNMVVTHPGGVRQTLVNLNNQATYGGNNTCGGRSIASPVTDRGRPSGSIHANDRYGGVIHIPSITAAQITQHGCELFIELAGVQHNPTSCAHLDIDILDVAIKNKDNRWWIGRGLRAASNRTTRILLGATNFTLTGAFVNHQTNNPAVTGGETTAGAIRWTNIR